MAASSFLPTDQGREDNVKVGYPRQGALQWRSTRFNFPNSGVRGAESDLACEYVKGHLLGRARDWYEIFRSKLVQNIATDFAQLKVALTKNFPVVRNRKDLDIQFYSSQQSRGQEPTDFICDLLKVHKKPGFSKSEDALVDHILVRLKPLVQDYVEVRNPKTTA
ncbi:uncharacterized protein TNCV_2100241 [Trichonephila clavipes]|nr:uncharacterized protein TNCV_2100241 [Trichonephila clavipes]